MSVQYMDKSGMTYFVGKVITLLNQKQNIEAGKGLSTNDLTNALKNAYDDCVTNAYKRIAYNSSTRVISFYKHSTAQSTDTPDFTVTLPADIDVSGKMDKVTSPTNGNVLITNASGQAVDGGTALSSLATTSYVDGKVASMYKIKGSIAFANLPTSGMTAGDVYNITDAFITTNVFIGGAGKSYPAGTNVVYINTSGAVGWDCLSGSIDLSGYVLHTDLVAITNSEIDDMFD